MAKDDPIRFGAEFGPKRTDRTKGVSLSTFKSLVWVSNLGGLILCAIALELMITGQFLLGLGSMIAGVVIALFPSNYEIVGMEESLGQSDGAELEDAE
ncbi:MAG: hypothetical protein CMB58_003625 [Methanobacteriota archaeon]|jgi:hypothetical protein|nr:hypothetical protein [Euryarchaeota archaeon]RAH16773.1 MAG: hypothetical protein CMB58_003625 [Euryarchaeota archaeon]|tara:strand:- start:537 stop:830 length:294 start_codon:yes stop_codon:yes gene_type:complete